MFEIDFEPVGRRKECSEELSLLECARQLGVELVNICGGVGTCERCKVQIISGRVSKPTLEEEAVFSSEELKQNYRLACLTYPLSDVKVHVPPESLTAPQRTQVEGLEVTVQPDPIVLKLDVQLEKPSLENPMADDQNLWMALADKYELAKGVIDYQVQQSLAQELRNNDWDVSIAIRSNEIVGVGTRANRWLGFAVDIGTTKIAGYLVDLQSGQTKASKGLMNPQISYGEDVVSRIAAASRVIEGTERLQRLLTDAVSQMVEELCAEINAQPKDIIEAVAVGNTVIHHLFLGLPVAQLGYAPYVPAVRSALDIKAREIGLRMAPGAYVHLLPNIAGYVGADHVAMLLATGMAEPNGVRLALDIGTNTEICLNSHGKMTSVSCASGPAFEGAHIKFGMRAAPGAIEHLRLKGERLEYQTIGGVTPVGVCGSGLLDSVAQLRLNNVLDRSGRMGEHTRVRVHNNVREFVLVSDEERGGLEAITVSQKDVRELQLAKAAIRLGIQSLIEANGLDEQDIEQVIIAGAFGTFIDIPSAITIGMLPPLSIERFKQVGNAAGTGARLALISRGQRAEAERIAQRVGYIELANVPDFQRKYTEATYLE